MTTVANLIDRLKRDWLEPADSQPARFSLGADIASTSATSITYDDTLLAPEEAELLGPGTLIEIDSEEMILSAVNEDTNTLTISKRGANGTTAATHTSGAEIFIAPTWRRRVMFDALCDAIVGLYPDLFQVTSTSLTVSSTTYTEVPAAVSEPLWFYGTLTGTTSYQQWPIAGSDWLDQFPPSSTGKAIVLGSLPTGAAGYLVYKTGFTRPTSEADVLATIGIDPQWEPILLVSAAAYLVAGRELEQVGQERLTQQLERQGFPVLTATRIRQGLLQYREALLEKAQDALRLRYPVQVHTTVQF